MSRRRSLAARLLMLLAVFSLIAAACGDDDSASGDGTTTDDGGAAPTATTPPDDGTATDGGADTTDAGTDGTDSGECSGGATDTGVTADSIKVTIIVSITGNNSAGQAGFEQGAEAYIEKLNDDGGICGRQIEFETLDDNSDPTVNAELMRQAYDDGTFLVMGSWPNWGDPEFACENNLPVIGTAYASGWQYCDAFFGVTGGSWKAPDINNIPAAPAATDAVDVYMMAETGATKAATFGYTQAQSAAAAEIACDNINDLAFDGAECVFADATVEFGFSSIGATASRIIESGATHFYAGMDIAGCVTFMNEIKTAGLQDFTFRCAVGIDDKNVETFGNQLENISIMRIGPDFTSDDPAMVEFVDELAIRKPGVDPGITTLNGWWGGIFLEDVLRAVGGDLTRENFVTTARTADQFKTWDANGLLGTSVDWTTNRHEAVLNGTYVAPPGCSGTLFVPDLDAGTFVPIEPNPLCLSGLSGAAIVDYAASTESGLEQ